MSQASVGASDLLPELVGSRLLTQRLGRAYEFVPTCASTNDWVRQRSTEGAAEGLVVVADSQSSGRGRLGRTWHSPSGQNLYFSLLLRPALPARQAAPLTLLAGAALAHTLAQAGAPPRLRWPNDLQLLTAEKWRKTAGILTEMATNGEKVRHIVLGVGLNVNSQDFPMELAERATSLRLSTGRAFDRGGLLASFLGNFEPLYDEFLAHGPGAGLAQWRRYADLGQICRRDGIEGIATGIDDSGALLVRDAAGTIHRLTSGETS